MPLLEEASQTFYEYEMWEDWKEAAICKGYYFRIKGEFTKAIKQLDSAMETIDRHSAIDKNFKFELNPNKAINFLYLTDYEAATDVMKRVLEGLEIASLAEEEKEGIKGRAFNIISAIFSEKREYDKALEFSFKSLEMVIKHSGKESMPAAGIYTSIGVKYYFLGNYEAAIENQLKSLQIKLKMFKDDYHPELKASYENLGGYYMAADELTKAEEYIIKAHEIRKNMFGVYHPEMANGLILLSGLSRKQQNYEQAKLYCLEAIEILDSLAYDIKELAEYYQLLGDINANLGLVEEALSCSHKALSLICRNLPSDDKLVTPSVADIILSKSAFLAVRDKLYLIQKHFQLYQDKNQLAQTGVELGELSLQLWEIVRLELTNQPKAKQIHVTSARNSVKYASLLAYELAKEIQQDIYNQKAFQLAEQGKALLLQEAYLQADVKKNTQLPHYLLEQEQQLSQQLVNYESQLLSAINQKDIAKENTLRNDSIFYTKRAYKKLLTEIKNQDPNYFDLEYAIPDISASDVQASLANEELFVEYLFDETLNELLIFVIDPQTGLHLYKQNLPSDVHKKAIKFNKLLRSYLLTRADKKRQFVHLSHEFYQALIAPIVPHLASHSFSSIKQPELSGIACIATAEIVTENGILFSGEVYNMAINSDLLVLSSCESGLGQLVAGEGMLGLNRSFVYAGVPNVVFSLWKVFDHITKDMMLQFYQYILDGHSYSAALRLVKLDMLQNKTTASPEFWGAFLLIGH